MISNYVLIFGSTTADIPCVIFPPLWIDFKLCSYFWFDNTLLCACCRFCVVNWFQIMFLFLVRQRHINECTIQAGCELISNYVLIFGSTTVILLIHLTLLLWIDFKLCSYFWFDNHHLNLISRLQLWIDFKLCSYFWFDNSMESWCGVFIVVNWFQIMFLFLVRQHGKGHIVDTYSCELISNYVLIFGSTTLRTAFAMLLPLWIDFKLCSYFWFDNTSQLHSTSFRVVNWFQIMFLFLVRQLTSKTKRSGCCCELISNYVLIFGSTTILNGLQAVAALWIDFKLCSYFWFDNVRGTDPLFLKVVNWFQIMFLFLVRQPLAFIVNFDDSCELISNYVLIFGSTTSLSPAEHSVCCELISNYVLIFGSTTKIFVTSAVWKLWIDFKLCSYFWFDNHRHFICLPQSVVNWFQIMFLFLVRQQRCLGFSGPFRCELISNYVLIFGSTTKVPINRFVC